MPRTFTDPTPLAVDESPSCVAELLVRAAERHPESGIHIQSSDYIQGIERMSYATLLQDARRVLGGLRDLGYVPGARVTLLLEDPRDFLTAFWACLLGGYIPCPLAPIRNDAERFAKHLSHVDALLGKPLCISTSYLLAGLPSSITSVDLLALSKCAALHEIHRAQSNELAVLMLTSGSTGDSKAVELTHRNLLASVAARAERQCLTYEDVTFNWIAFDHVAALLESHMVATFVGAAQVHTLPAVVLSDPLQFLRIIDHHRVTLAFAPNFLLGQINAALQIPDVTESGRRPLAVDLSCLRRIVTGGEANVVETSRRFLDLLAPYQLSRDALWPAFGMTETCAACVYSDEFPDLDEGREFATVGRPLEGLDIRIVDDDGAARPAGHSGELQLRGPMIFPRYYNNDEVTRSTFTADGWFRTGDVGSFEDGRLRLLARNKDSIIVSGVNYFSHEIENRLEQLEGVERSYIAAFPTRPKGADTEQLVVVFSTTLSSTEDDKLHQLIVAIRNTTIMLWGFRPTIILPLPRRSFPKTSLGKIQRSLMRKRLEGGDFNIELARTAAIIERRMGPYVAPSGPVEMAIAKVFADILKLDLSTVNASASFFDLGGTSLDIMRLARALQGFKLTATVPLVLQNPTVTRLARMVGKQEKGGSYDPIIPLQLTGGGTPLFCIHPGNGEVFVLVNLAKYFVNERPFYALRPRGFNEEEKQFGSVEEIVNTYVEAILTKQPKGPFAIAGYSLGCRIAFEVSKELQLRGHEIAFLGAIDFTPCWKPLQLPFNMATALALVLDLIDRNRFIELNRDLRPDLPTDQVCGRVLSYASAERLNQLDLDLQKFAIWARVAYSIETLLLSHKTTGCVAALTVFCSDGFLPKYDTTDAGTNREVWRPELERWRGFANHTRFVDVPGDHHGLMGPQHVASFQALLRAEINAALN